MISVEPEDPESEEDADEPEYCENCAQVMGWFDRAMKLIESDARELRFQSRVSLWTALAALIAVVVKAWISK